MSTLTHGHGRPSSSRDAAGMSLWRLELVDVLDTVGARAVLALAAGPAEQFVGLSHALVPALRRAHKLDVE